MMNSDVASPPASYWCYNCTHFVHLLDQEDVACPHCQSGFIEEIHNHPSSDHRHLNPFLPSIFLNLALTSYNFIRQGFHRRRCNASNRSPFNPVNVLRGPVDEASGQNSIGADQEESSFKLYYDDGDDSNLRPLPLAMSEFLLGSGFEWLLEQFAHIEMNGFGCSV